MTRYDAALGRIKEERTDSSIALSRRKMKKAQLVALLRELEYYYLNGTDAETDAMIERYSLYNPRKRVSGEELLARLTHLRSHGRQLHETGNSKETEARISEV